MAALLLLAATAPARAGSLTTHDPDGVEWSVIDDPAEGRDGYLLKRTGKDHKPDPTFGRSGTTEFTLGNDADSPTSLRVETSRRIWMSGNAISGAQPQPVVARFNADGTPDTRWGVQGRLTIAPGGVSMRATDVYPMADGGALVSCEAPGAGNPRAVVFKLKADGTLDPTFGKGGVWQRPGNDGAAAIGFAASSDGSVAVAVSVRTPKPMGEVWILGDVPPSIAAQQELDENMDEDEVHLEYTGGRWAWVMNAGIGSLVTLGVLARPAPAPASAPADLGQGAFNPFAGGGSSASAASGTGMVEADDGPPWVWIGVIGALVAGLAGVFLMKGRGR